jgi:hypothetical protein
VDLVDARAVMLTRKGDLTHVQGASSTHKEDWVCVRKQCWARREDLKTNAQCFGMQRWGSNWRLFGGPVWTS